MKTLRKIIACICVLSMTCAFLCACETKPSDNNQYSSLPTWEGEEITSSQISDNEQNESQISDSENETQGAVENVEKPQNNNSNTSSKSQANSTTSKKPSNTSSKPGASEGTTTKPQTTPSQNTQTQTPTQTQTQTPTQTPSQQNKPLKALSADEYYGWTLLKKSGSEAEKKVYKQLVSDIGSYKNTITFDFSLTKAEFENAYGLYKEDYPEHFWRGSEYTLSSSNNKVNKVTFKNGLYDGNVSKIKTAKNKVDAAVAKILATINGSMSDFEKEVAVHDYIIDHTEYKDETSSHTIVGVFVDSKAVCQGYSLAFQYIMRLAGVQCITITGNFNNQSHMWNMIELDNEFYHVDVTSDDPIVDTGEQVVDFNYFNLTDAQIKLDHKINNKEFTPPKATATKYEFFKQTNQVYDEYTVEAFAKSIAYAYKHGYKYAYMRFEKVSLLKASTFIGLNYRKIIDKANEILGSKKIKYDTRISVMYGEQRGILNLKINY